MSTYKHCSVSLTIVVKALDQVHIFSYELLRMDYTRISPINIFVPTFFNSVVLGITFLSPLIFLFSLSLSLSLKKQKNLLFPSGLAEGGVVIKKQPKE